ncbi:MAG: serine--tRNA ligase [Sandaracinus sp.]|nr:serine--tRNA ligase [Sandaracinus sp.]MCB9633619.1 serine--tRNA ligase [Sandaracinus sp.]
MLDLRLVTESLDEVKAQLARRGFKDEAILGSLSKLAADRRAAIAEVESKRAELNAASGAMAKIADKKSAEFAEKREALRTLGDRIKELEARRVEVESELQGILLGLPNLPDPSTPDGLDESANVVVRTWGQKPTLDFAPKDHVDLGTGLGLIDFERARKVSGARFSVLKGLGARLERGLMQLMLDLHVDEHGYEEVWVPALVKDSALRGTSQLPKFEKDIFKLAGKLGEDDAESEGGYDLYLIPTAEVPVTNLHADEILELDQLPIAYAAYTPCFRSEAGSHGRDTRGMIRQHQFDKVELVRFVTPEQALEEHEKLTAHAEAVLQRLGLHYRVVQLCAGDMGFAAKKCFDIEVWLPGQDAYREISSCSWFGDFQARRMGARYRPAPKAKPQLLHTINGSGLAIGRTLVAVLEQYQQADGTVVIPEALRPYVGGREKIG